MIHSIYQKVFGTTTDEFDPTRNFYIVLINFTGKSIHETSGAYVNKNGFEEIFMDLSEAQTAGFVEGKLYESYSLRQSPFIANNGIHYIVLAEYEEDIGIQLGNVLQQLTQCRFLTSNDEIILVATLPEEKNTAVSHLRNLEKESCMENIPAYFFVREKYKEASLRSAIGGVFLLYGEKTMYEAFKRNFSDLKYNVNAGEQSLPDAGRDELSKRSHLYWSTLSAYENNEKMMFLSRYLDGLYSNCMLYKEVSCKDVCVAFFQELADLTNKRLWLNRLEKAVQCIPRIIQTEPDQHQSLENYFLQLYGSDGLHIVELTLQINLQNRFVFTKQIIKDAVKVLFDHAKEYYTRSLITDVLDHIDEYIKNDLAMIISRQQDAVRKFVKEEADIQIDLPVYIERYMNYCDALQQRALWTEVKNYITINANLFDEQNQNAIRIADDLDRKKRELPLTSSRKGDEYPKYVPTRLLDIESDDEICRVIQRAYDASEQGTRNNYINVPNAGVYPDIFPSIPLFYREYRYDPLPNQMNTLLIYQRIGRYYMFGE